jgi:hypothetical protein
LAFPASVGGNALHRLANRQRLADTAVLLITPLHLLKEAFQILMTMDGSANDVSILDFGSIPTRRIVRISGTHQSLLAR